MSCYSLLASMVSDDKFVGLQTLPMRSLSYGLGIVSFFLVFQQFDYSVSKCGGLCIHPSVICPGS